VTVALDELAKPATGPGFADALTYAFAEDPGTGAAGFLRVGLAVGEDGEKTGSLLAVLFDAGEPVAALARGAIPVGADADWAHFEVPGARTAVLAPLGRWTAAFADDAGAGFSLEFAAVGPPAAQGEDDEAARLGGMAGYEQLCRVQGTIRVGGRDREVRCAGQRGHAWGVPDWGRMEAARTVTAWLDDDSGFTLSAVRPAGADGHERDAVWGAVLGADGARSIADPRLTTAWDDDGHQRRAGLELWLDEADEAPRRAAGLVRCGSTLDLGRLRLDCAFFSWVADGRRGVGRYDVLRRA
jgi:hypothetical protein